MGNSVKSYVPRPYMFVYQWIRRVLYPTTTAAIHNLLLITVIPLSADEWRKYATSRTRRFYRDYATSLFSLNNFLFCFLNYLFKFVIAEFRRHIIVTTADGYYRILKSSILKYRVSTNKWLFYELWKKKSYNYYRFLLYIFVLSLSDILLMYNFITMFKILIVITF